MENENLGTPISKSSEIGTVDTHLSSLYALITDIKNTLPAGPNVVNSKMIEASYHSATISKLLAVDSNDNIRKLELVMKEANANIGNLEVVMQKANINISSLEVAMTRVEGIVEKSDKKARNIFWAAIFTLFVAIITFVDAYESSRKDEPYKEKLIEINLNTERDMNGIEELLKKQQVHTFKEAALMQRIDSLLAMQRVQKASALKTKQ